MPKVLLVEDNEESRDALSRHLRRKGYEILLAVDGRQGMDVARAEAPDLILIDMSLPVLDGWEATRQLKAGSATRGIPVIALTAHAMAGDRERALEAGCDDYETKPIEFPRLLTKIESLLGKKSAPAPGEERHEPGQSGPGRVISLPPCPGCG
jgi:CheY-like chemotaxis protein